MCNACFSLLAITSSDESTLRWGEVVVVFARLICGSG